MSINEQTKFHTVTSGQTLYSIAQSYNISVEELQKLNGIQGGIIKVGQKLTLPNEITMSSEISDAQIEQNLTREKYISTRENGDYKVQQNDNLEKIADKFQVEVARLKQTNNLTGNEILSIGKILKIPPTRTVKNINNLSDVAKALGVSEEFLSQMKEIEDGTKSDGKKYKKNEFHNTPYIDATGHKTIGIGHWMKSNEQSKLSNKEVLELFAKDLMKAEENLWVTLGGEQNYNKLPQNIKEALLDMVFNKGTAILNPDLLYRLKNNKYEAAINTMTSCKALDGKEYSGLNKRRLFDISTACKIYNGDIPQSNLSTIQQVYDHGVELLKKECSLNGANFDNMLVGYNDDIKAYLGDSIKSIRLLEL